VVALKLDGVCAGAAWAKVAPWVDRLSEPMVWVGLLSEPTAWVDRLSEPMMGVRLVSRGERGVAEITRSGGGGQRRSGEMASWGCTSPKRHSGSRWAGAGEGAVAQWQRKEARPEGR